MTSLPKQMRLQPGSTFQKFKCLIGKARARIRSIRERIFIEASFQLFRLKLNRMEASKELTAVILTCNPNPLYDACLDSVKKQTLPASKIEVVSDIHPVSKAEQMGLQRVKTKYYVSVDADMVLDSTFFERLYFILRQNPKNALSTLAAIDPILGKSSAGVRMYLTQPVARIGYHPFNGFKDHDRYMKKTLISKGYLVVQGPWIGGKHHPIYLPNEAYWKFRINSEKARYYGDRYPCFRDLVDSVTDYWQRTHNDIALYALAGLFEGLKSESIDGELTYDGRESDPTFMKIKAFLEQTGVHEK